MNAFVLFLSRINLFAGNIMGTINLQKNILRKEMKRKIALLSERQKILQSDIVTEKVLKNQNFKESKRISIYINTTNEIQTTKLIEQIFKFGKTCFIPRYSFDEIRMDMVKLHSLEDLASLPLTKWKIKQPDLNEKRENALHTGGLDMIFVPGLAFTKEGKRMGRGKGYYDMFLKECYASQPNPPITAGLAFEEQICSDIPTDEHDFKLDFVIYNGNCS